MLTLSSLLPNSEEFHGFGDELLAPEMITPDEYFGRLRSALSDQPERRLMLAVLEETLVSYKRALINVNKATKTEKVRRAASRLIQECEEWFESDDCNFLYNFDSICDALDIDPSNMRGGIHRLKKTILAKKRTKKTPRPRLRDSERWSAGRHAIKAKRVAKKRVDRGH